MGASGAPAREVRLCGVLMVPSTGQDHVSNVHKMSSWLVMVKFTCCISSYCALEAWGQPASLGSVSGSAPEEECLGARMGIVWCCLVVAHPGLGMHLKC
jgi:hypothetical protein